MISDILTGSWRPGCGHTYLAKGNGKIYSLRSLPDGSYLRVRDEAAGSLIGEYPTPGKHSCHITLLPGKAVVSDYTSGSLSVYALNGEGIPVAAPVVRCFSDRSRIHSSWISPSDGLLTVVDAGADCLYRFDADNSDFPNCGYETFHMPAGSAPRHGAFNDCGDRLYVSTEYSDEVLVLEYPSMALLQRCEVNPAHPRGGAHVALSPDGRFAYVSSRLSNDGIAVFQIVRDGLLKKNGYTRTGAHPRHFSLNSDGSRIAVACRDSGRVEIYDIDRDSGLLSRLADSLQVEKPVFVSSPW